MSWNGKKSLCIDFDGVIHLYTRSFKAHDIIEDEPHPQAFKALEEYLTRFQVYIYSSRSSSPEGIEAMRKWFREHKCSESVLRQLIFSEKKPPAVVYLDDRGWCFNGKFPTVEEIDDFKPWNRR
jgi:hypothetical protein